MSVTQQQRRTACCQFDAHGWTISRFDQSLQNRAKTRRISICFDCVDRLLRRREDPSDRRRKALATTAAADSVLRKLEIARSRDFELGLAPIAPELLAQVAPLLERAIAQLEEGSAATSISGRRR